MSVRNGLIKLIPDLQANMTHPRNSVCLPRVVFWALMKSVNNFPMNLSLSSGLSNMEGVQGNNRFFQALTYELQSNL